MWLCKTLKFLWRAYSEGSTAWQLLQILGFLGGGGVTGFLAHLSELRWSTIVLIGFFGGGMTLYLMHILFREVPRYRLRRFAQLHYDGLMLQHRHEQPDWTAQWHKWQSKLDTEYRRVSETLSDAHQIDTRLALVEYALDPDTNDQHLKDLATLTRMLKELKEFLRENGVNRIAI